MQSSQSFVFNEPVLLPASQLGIRQFLDRGVYPNIQSFSAKLPLIVQKRDYSDINKTFDSNYYVITYNWNVYLNAQIAC